MKFLKNASLFVLLTLTTSAPSWALEPSNRRPAATTSASKILEELFSKIRDPQSKPEDLKKTLARAEKAIERAEGEEKALLERYKNFLEKKFLPLVQKNDSTSPAEFTNEDMRELAEIFEKSTEFVEVKHRGRHLVRVGEGLIMAASFSDDPAIKDKAVATGLRVVNEYPKEALGYLLRAQTLNWDRSFSGNSDLEMAKLVTQCLEVAPREKRCQNQLISSLARIESPRCETAGIEQTLAFHIEADPKAKKRDKVQLKESTGNTYDLGAKPEITISDIAWIQRRPSEETNIGLSASWGYQTMLVDVQLSPDGTKKFADLTTKARGKKLAVVVKNEVLAAPIINTPITAGNAVISIPHNKGEKAKFQGKDLTGDEIFDQICLEKVKVEIPENVKKARSKIKKI